MEQSVLFQKEARARLLQGAKLLADSVKGTLGPCGHHVVMQKEYGTPLISNDGVTIAKALYSEDPYAQMGISLLLESAIKTNEISGDGTTTSILLAYELLNGGFAAMAQGGAANGFVLGMETAAKAIETYLRAHAQKLNGYDEIAKLAGLSAKSQTIGNLIAEAFEAVSNARCIVCESGKSYESRLRIQEGTELHASLLSPYFLPSDATSLTYERPYLFISNERIVTLTQIEHFLAYAISMHRPLLILCEDMESDVLAQLILLNRQKRAQVCVYKAPAFGTYQQDMLEDLALLCSGSACIHDLGLDLSALSVNELGEAKEMILRKHSLQVFVQEHAGVKERIALLKERCKEEQRAYDKAHMERRIAALQGRLAVLEIGGYTKGEIEEKKMRCEDALQASAAAMAEGVVSGGGLALIQSYRALHKEITHERKDSQAGIDCVFQAICKPFLQLMENNYEHPKDMLEQQLNQPEGIGYDVWEGKWCDLLACGISDPLQVVLQALHNAVSVAGLLIRCDVAMLKR
ncbi:MAG: chaperonin GroEL [Erysipelotrichaceae bacterium]|nr:chaperonin GroEL [Erysipelotrichaceae bacterium]